jgi:hypothetical protein
MALLAVQQIAVTGSTPSYAAVSASDTIQPDGNDNLFLHVKNGGGSPDTVTIVIPGVYLGVALADLTVSVPATTGDRMIAIPAAAMDPATGLITVTHSFTTSVTQGLFRR